MITSKLLILITLLFTTVNIIAQDCPKDFIEELSYNTAAGGTVNSFQPALEIHACKQNYRGSTGQNVWWSVKGLFFHYKKVQFTKKYVLTCGNTITKRVVLFDLKVGDRRTGSTFGGDLDLADGFFKSECDADDLNRIKSVSVSNVTCVLADDEPMVIEEKARLKKLADEKKKKILDNSKSPSKKTETKAELTDDEKLNEAMMKHLEKDFDEKKNKKAEPVMTKTNNTSKTPNISNNKNVSRPVYAYVNYFYNNGLSYFSDVIDVTLLDSCINEIKFKNGRKIPELNLYANRMILWFDNKCTYGLKDFQKRLTFNKKNIKEISIYFSDKLNSHCVYHSSSPDYVFENTCICYDEFNMKTARLNEIKRWKSEIGYVFEIR